MTPALAQRPAFKRTYKKLHPNQREEVHAAIRTILSDLFLLANTWGDSHCKLLSLGPHENVYRDLKR